ncbi:transformer-2 protein homolog alpha/beta [Phanerochaete sordida]|uniref:Transformer-2 protein homolog alpha/beta n=1 Tax=Phanerochaete sordida TaxID=48140 RepID=A0A9P3FY84_9APHY|nr:transformer-2 protein homolog alpha/beta [Phanerochaete sordida]
MDTQYGESAPPPADPYAEAYNDQPSGAHADRDREVPPPRGRSRSRSPVRDSFRRPSPTPKRPSNAPVQAPNPSSVLGVFGLSIRTVERDLDEEFSRFGRVEKVVIVYDQRSDRSRGFGFITMSTVEEAGRCIKELNGVELNGRRIRVDYSVTDRPHAPTPGEYMGHRRRRGRDTYSSERGERNDRYDRYDEPRDRRDRDRGERDPYSSRRYDRDERDRDHYGRDRDWRDRRSPPPRSRAYSPDYRRRRSYSRSPPRGSSPVRGGRDYDGPSTSAAPASNGEPRW